MEIEERQTDGVVRLYVRGSFVCSAKVLACVQLKNFFLKNAGINLKWRLDVEEVEKRFFENVSALSTVLETASKGWFYNVCQLTAFRCPARFGNLRTRIDGKSPAAEPDLEHVYPKTSDLEQTIFEQSDLEQSISKQSNLKQPIHKQSHFEKHVESPAAEPDLEQVYPKTSDLEQPILEQSDLEQSIPKQSDLKQPIHKQSHFEKHIESPAAEPDLEQVCPKTSDLEQTIFEQSDLEQPIPKQSDLKQPIHKLSHFEKHVEVAMVKVGKEQLLLMTNNKLADRLGLKPMSSSSDGPSIYCIHMSRESSQAKGGLVDFHIRDEKRCSQYLHTKSDPYIRGFRTWPPDSSLLTKETVSKVFQKQYDMYRNLKSETSCARIDHQYIEKKLVKGDNLDKEENVEDEERMHVEAGNHEEGNYGKPQDVKKKHVKGDNVEKENQAKGGKTERRDVGEEILPDRKRHKSENHKQRQEPEDKHSSEIRKRHRTTSDASSFTSVELDTKSSASSIRDESGHASDKKHVSSRKHVHGSDRKEKQSKESQKHKSDKNDKCSKESQKEISDRKDKHSKESQKEKKGSSQRSKVSDEVIDLTKDENVNPNCALGKKASDMSRQSDNESQKIREKDRTLKHSGKESLLSKLESSLKSMKKKDKEKTEEKKSKHCDKHRSSSKSSKSDKPMAGLGKQRNVEQVFSSMFSGLTKELGRIPKKNKATSETPVGSVDDQSNAMKETKKSNDSKNNVEKVEKSSKSKSHKSDKKDKESKHHKDSKHKHDKDKDKDRTKKSKHHKEKTKRMSDLEPVIASEREDDVDVFDSVGNGFDVQEMVRDALSGREKLNTKSSGETVTQSKMNEEKEAVIPGFGDLDELDVFQSRSKAEVKHIKRSVRVTDSDLKISLPADIVRKGEVGVKLDLQTLVNLALFGDEVTSQMTAVCLHLYDCVRTLHDFSPSSWTKSVTKEKVEAKNKHLYTVKMFNPEHVQNIGNTGEKLNMESDKNKQEKTNRRGFDDVTNKLMSIVQKEKSKDWTFPEKGKLSGKCSTDKVLVIPRPTMTNLSSDEDDCDDEVSDTNIGLDNEKDKRIVISGKIDFVNGLDKSKDAKEVKTDREVIGQVKDVRSETDNGKIGAAATSMAAPTSRPNTQSVNQIRKRRSSSTEKECSREKSRNSKKSESQDRKRSRSKERNSRDNSKDRRRSRSRHRSSRSHSRDRNRRSQSKERSRRSPSRTETPTECDKVDIGKRLEKIAASAVSSDPDKMTNRTDKRRERQYHPYKKDSRPSKRHIPHWSFDLAYSDMNELLQNLTENTFKKTNSRPANVGSRNKVGRRSYGNRGRFASFRFRRSAVPRTPPREVYSSSEDEEYMVRPDDIPDLRERAKQADVLENYMGADKDEKEFSKEMLIYEKENKEDKRIVCKKGNGSSQDLIIPGGPKTSTFSAQELEDSTDASGELAFLGSGRHVENLDSQTSQSSVIERQDTYTNNLIRSKIEEMKSSNKEKKHSAKDGSGKEGAKVNTHKPDDKKCESNETGMSVKEKCKMSKSEETVKEREKVYVSLDLSNDSPVTVHSENEQGSKNRTEEDRDLAKENAQKKILSSESDVCLDWTDEEVALDKKETVVFDDSSDGMSDSGHSRSYIVLDMIEESDTELSTKPQADKVSERKEKSMLKDRESLGLDSLISKPEIKEMDSAAFLSDIEKSVQKSVESMVDSVCLNVSDSAYTVVDECTITPENSISDTSELETTLAEFFQTPESESTPLKPVGEIFKIKECRVVLTRVHSVESFNSAKDSDAVGRSGEEERTSFEEKIIEDKANQFDEEWTSIERKSNEELMEEKVDQYDEERTSVERKSIEELIEEKVDQYDEERTSEERKSNEKMTEEIPTLNEENKNEDNEMLCDKLRNCEIYEPEKKIEVEPFSKRKEPVMVDSLPSQKLLEGSEEKGSTENSVAGSFMQEVIGDCIARIDFVGDQCSPMDGKECSDVLDCTEIMDEAGDRMLPKGTGMQISEGRQKSLRKAKENYLLSIQSEASCTSPLISISSENSKELSPSVYSEDSQTSTEIDPTFFGRDRLVLIDDIVVTGVSEIDITRIGKEMNVLEHQKKDKFVRQYEMYRNSLVDGNDSDFEDVPDLDEFVETCSNEDNQFHASVKEEHSGGIGPNTAYCIGNYATIDDISMKILSSCHEECFPNSTSAEGNKKENVQPERNIFDIMENDLHVKSNEKHEVKQVHEGVSTEGSFNFRTANESDLTDLVNDTENVLIEIHTISIDDTECETHESSDSSKLDKSTHNFSQVKQGHEVQIPRLFNTTAINVSREQNVEVDGCIRVENVYNIVKTENDFEPVQKGGSEEHMNEIDSSCAKLELEFDFKKGNLSDNWILGNTENVKSEPNVFLKEVPEGYTEIIGDYHKTDSQVNDLQKPNLCTSVLTTTDVTLDTEIVKNMQNDSFKDTETNSKESEVIGGTGDTPSSLVKEIVPNTNVTCTQSFIPVENSSESSSTVVYDLKDPQQTIEGCKVDFSGIVDEDDESTSSTWAYPLSELENESSQRSSTYLSQIDDDAVFHIKDTIDEEMDEKTLATEDVADAVNGNNNSVEGLLSAEVTADLNIEVEESEAIQLGQEISEHHENANQLPELYNPGVITPTPYFPRPWLPVNRHPYDMWPTYSVWQPFLGPSSPVTSPHVGPPTQFMPSDIGHRSPLSPFIWNSIPVYASNSGYSGSAGYSPYFMNYIINGSRQPVLPHQSPPSAVGMAPWIISSDNMTPYLQDQNPDTYFLTEHIVEKKFDDKESKKEKVCFEALPVLDIPVHEIPLPKSSPAQKRNNPRKLKDMCEEILDDSRQRLNSQKHVHNIETSTVNNLTLSTSVEYSESENTELCHSLHEQSKDFDICNGNIQEPSSSKYHTCSGGDTLSKHGIVFQGTQPCSKNNKPTVETEVLVSKSSREDKQGFKGTIHENKPPVISLENTDKNESDQTCLTGKALNSVSHMSGVKQPIDHDLLRTEDVNVVQSTHTLLNSSVSHKTDEQTPKFEPDEEISCNGKKHEIVESRNISFSIGHPLSTLKNTITNEKISRAPTDREVSVFGPVEEISCNSNKKSVINENMPNLPIEANALFSTLKNTTSNGNLSKTEKLSFPNDSVETKFGTVLSKKYIPEIIQNEVMSKGLKENKHVETGKVKSRLKTSNVYSGVGTILKFLKNSDERLQNTEKQKLVGTKHTEVTKCTLCPADEHNCELREGNDFLNKEVLPEHAETVITSDKVEAEVGNNMIDCEFALFHKDFCEVKKCANPYEDPVDLGKTSTDKAETNAECDELAEGNETKMDHETSRNTCIEVTIKHLHDDTECVGSSHEDSKSNVESVRKGQLLKIQEVDSEHSEAGVGKMNDGKELNIDKFDISCNTNNRSVENENIPDQFIKANILYSVGHLLDTLKNTKSYENISKAENINFPDVDSKTDTGAVPSPRSFLKIRRNEVMSRELEENEHEEKGKVRSKLKIPNVCYGVGTTLNILKNSDRRLLKTEKQNYSGSKHTVVSEHSEAGVGKMNDGKELDIDKFDISCNNNNGSVENENIPDQFIEANVLDSVGCLFNTKTNENLPKTENINFPDVNSKTNTGTVPLPMGFPKIRRNEVMSNGLEENEHVEKGKVRSKLKTQNVFYGVGTTLDILKDRKPLKTEKQNCSGSKHTEITKRTFRLADEHSCKLREGDEFLAKNSVSEDREKLIIHGKLKSKVGNDMMESELALFYKDICEVSSDENVLNVGKAATYTAKQNADWNELAKEGETKMDVETSRNTCSEVTVKHLHVDTDCMSSSHKDTESDVETVSKSQLPEIHTEKMNDGKELNSDKLEIEDGNQRPQFETKAHENKAFVTRIECESDSTDAGKKTMSSVQMFADERELTEDSQSEVNLKPSEKENEITTEEARSACSEGTMACRIVDGSLSKSDLPENGSDISENMAVLVKDADVCIKKDTSVSHVKSIPSLIQQQMVESKDSSEIDSAADCKEDQVDVELRATAGLVKEIEEQDSESTFSGYDKTMPVDNLDVSLTISGVCKVSKDLGDRTDRNSIHSIHSTEQCFVTDKVKSLAGEIDHVSHSFVDDSTMGAENQSKSRHEDSNSEDKATDNEKMFPTLDCPISEIPLPDTKQCETSSREQTVSKSVDSVSKNEDANISVSADFVSSDSYISVNPETRILQKCSTESSSMVQNALLDLRSSYKIDDSETLLAQGDSAVSDIDREVAADTEMITSHVQLKSNNFDISGSNHSGVVYQNPVSSSEISSTGKNIKPYCLSESSEIMLCVENIMKCKWTEGKDEIDNETEKIDVENELDLNLLKSEVLLSSTPGSPSKSSEKRSRKQHADVRQRLEKFKCKVAETKYFEEDLEHAREITDEQITNNKCVEQNFNSRSAEFIQRAENSMKWKLTEREDVDIKTEKGGEQRTETEVMQKTNETECYLNARGVVRTSDTLNEKPVEVNIFLTDKKEQHVASNKRPGFSTAQKSNEQKDITQYLRRRGVVSHRIKPSTKCVLQSLFGIKGKDRSAAKNAKDKMHQQRNQLRLKAMFRANQLNCSEQAVEERDKETKLAYTKEWINQSVQQIPVVQIRNEKNKVNLDFSDKAELPGDRRSGSVSSSTTSSRRTYSNRSSSRSSSVESEFNRHTYKFKSRTYRKHQETSGASTVAEHENGKPSLPGNGNNVKMTGSQQILLGKNSPVRKVGSKRFCRRYRSMSSSSKSDLSEEHIEYSDSKNKRKTLIKRRKKSSSSSQDRHKRCKSGNKSSSGSSWEWKRREKSKSARKRSYSSSSSDRYKRETPIRGYRSRSRRSRGKYSPGKTRSRRYMSYSSSRERSFSSSSREAYRKEKRRSSRKRSTSSSSRKKHGLDGHYHKRESRWSEYHRQMNRFRNIFPSSQSYYSETSSDSQRLSDSSSCSRSEYGRGYKDAFNKDSACVDRVNSSNNLKKSMKQKQTIVQEQELSRITKGNPEPVLDSSSSDMNGSTSKGQRSPKGGELTEAMKALAQYTEGKHFDSPEHADERKNAHEEKFSAGVGNSQNIKTVLLKPAVLRKLTPAGLGKFLQILDQYSTDRCEWCLALFAADVMALEDSKQEAVRIIENQYRNFTIMSDVNSVDSYLVMELRNPSVLEIFVIIEPPDEDENIRSLIRYCCMEKFLEEHISSM